MTKSASAKKILPEAFNDALRQVREQCTLEDGEDPDTKTMPPIFDQMATLAAGSEEIKTLFHEALTSFMIGVLMEGPKKSFATNFARAIKTTIIACELAVQDNDVPKEINHLDNMDLDLELSAVEVGISDVIRAEDSASELAKKMFRLDKSLSRIREILNQKGLL